jgi:nifR3 family TIM-barrel protein
MAGISDFPFRTILKSFGAGITFSEMISSEAFVRGHRKTRGILRRSEWERPFGIQIFGGNPAAMAETARRLEAEGLCDLIDINLGCSVKKVMRSGAGAALMMDRKRLFETVERVVDAVSLPVTAKLRACRTPNDTMGLDLIPKLFSIGIRAVTMHARCVTWAFSHPPEWDWIDQAVALGCSLVGNGGIFTPEDAVKMAEQTGCDGIMIARGYLGNPWIFWGIRRFIESGTWEPVLLEVRFGTMKTHLRLSLEVFGERQGVLKMRKHLAWYVKGLPLNVEFRREINKLHESTELFREIDRYYERLKIKGKR